VDPHSPVVEFFEFGSNEVYRDLHLFLPIPHCGFYFFLTGLNFFSHSSLASLYIVESIFSWMGFVSLSILVYIVPHLASILVCNTNNFIFTVLHNLEIATAYSLYLQSAMSSRNRCWVAASNSEDFLY
jgi:hypothetical protein